VKRAEALRRRGVSPEAKWTNGRSLAPSRVLEVGASYKPGAARFDHHIRASRRRETLEELVGLTEIDPPPYPSLL
jgi:uncharacterized UPF0160 family protein